LTGLVVRNGRSGWYLRVLEQGWIEAQLPVVLIERPNPAWSIARANEILHHRKTILPVTLELADVPGLAGSWVEELRERADRLRAPTARGLWYEPRKESREVIRRYRLWLSRSSGGRGNGNCDPLLAGVDDESLAAQKTY
jgi:hypothetical protein